MSEERGMQCGRQLVKVTPTGSPPGTSPRTDRGQRRCPPGRQGPGAQRLQFCSRSPTPHLLQS